MYGLGLITGPYDPAVHGAPSWYADLSNPAGTAATLEELTAQQALYAAYLKDHGLTQADGTNAVAFGPGLPTESDYGRVARELAAQGASKEAIQKKLSDLYGVVNAIAATIPAGDGAARAAAFERETGIKLGGMVPLVLLGGGAILLLLLLRR